MTPRKPKNDKVTLPKFEGRAVIRSAVAIRKAGDGLSDALKVEPVAFKHGQKVFFVLEGEVRSVDHDPIEKDALELVRTHVIDTVGIAVVAEEDVIDLIEADRERVQSALDEMQNEGTIFDNENGGAAAREEADQKRGKTTASV